jgi:hypothetical protein
VIKAFGPTKHPDPEMPNTPIPVGTPCAWCEELFTAEDCGFTLPFFGGQGHLRTELPFHSSCHLRQVLGSLAHVRRECSCYVPGSTCTDPPGMSRREAACAAVVEWMQLNGEAMQEFFRDRGSKHERAH